MKDRSRTRAMVGVFAVLIGSYAYFWHSRDWNTSSRLMLTYALVDRGTLSIDGLENQTGDKAFYEGRYFSDKLPGYPFLATLPYAADRAVFGVPPHPLNVRAMAHWPADYGVTVATSGLTTALTALLLMVLSTDLGCTTRQTAIVGLAYGLATPAYVYATLAYGHQTTAFALTAAFVLIFGLWGKREGLALFAAGLLASYAAVVELQVGPVSAVLGFALIGLCLSGRRRPGSIVAFGLGALGPALVLLLYNSLAFGGPLDMGYFHHATDQFARVHSKANPLGLRSPDWGRAVALLWGRHRGLLFYAPVLALAVPGWGVLVARRRYGVAVASFLAVAAVFLVNLSYPEWSGGWSTGPRLLTPLLPFAMIPVAATLATRPPWGRAATIAIAALGLAGGVLMLLFQGVGARLPQDVLDPLVEAVWPLWRGGPLPPWWTGERFARNLGGLAWPSTAGSWVQFLPLVAFQAVGIGLILATTGSDQGVDNQQEGRRADQGGQDPEAKP